MPKVGALTGINTSIRPPLSRTRHHIQRGKLHQQNHKSNAGPPRKKFHRTSLIRFVKHQSCSGQRLARCLTSAADLACSWRGRLFHVSRFPIIALSLGKICIGRWRGLARRLIPCVPCCTDPRIIHKARLVSPSISH